MYGDCQVGGGLAAADSPRSDRHTDGLEHVSYQGVIKLVADYRPPLTCREHMLQDLPQVTTTLTI